jgi:UDP-N-acetylmuramoylalanine--D-glutamate ligase
VTTEGGLEALATCQVVLKSPGISKYRDDVEQLRHAGVNVTSALAVWLAGTDRSRVIAVTGTKGKSTTTSLITFMLGTIGIPAVSAGNIGVAPYDPGVVLKDQIIVLEVSSFQACDILDAPSIIAITSLGEDHLDWHGSRENYQRDKLSLTHAEGDHTTILAKSSELTERVSDFGGHVRISGPAEIELASSLGLLGEHNARNVSLAVAVVAQVSRQTSEKIRADVEQNHVAYSPLPGRFSVVCRRHGITFIDDGLATSPLPVIAALRICGDQPVSLLVGGFDRGVDYHGLVTAISKRNAPTRVFGFGPAGQRITSLCLDVTAHQFGSFAEATTAASRETTSGFILFSPGAPSFDAYTDWLERSTHFRELVRD